MPSICRVGLEDPDESESLGGAVRWSMHGEFGKDEPTHSEEAEDHDHWGGEGDRDPEQDVEKGQGLRERSPEAKDLGSVCWGRPDKQGACEDEEWNVEVGVLSLHTGWDLTDRKVQAKFLDRVQEEEPDEILMAPMCRLWSQMQELSASRSPEAKQKLAELRRQDHNNVLQFVKRVYTEQYNNSREVTLEHPWTSRAWMTKAWHQLPGYETYVDQNAYGLKVPDDEGVVRPSKKPTKFLTTKKHLYHKVGRTCQCGEPHQALEGNAPGAGPRTKLAESCPIALARKLAEAISTRSMLPMRTW